MTTDWKALAADLAAELERCRPLAEVPDCLARARAALAAEAAGEGPTLQLPEQAPDEHPPSNLDRREVAAWYHGHGCGWQAARAVLARNGHQPAPPAEGEVGELVAWLQCVAEEVRTEDYATIHSPDLPARAADLLERQVVAEESSVAAPVPVGEVRYAKDVRRMCEIILGNTFGNEELDSLALLVGHHPDVLNAFHVPTEEAGEVVAELRMMANQVAEACQFTDAENLSRAADLLEQRHPTPVPVAERPWEREGWCDGEGQCWMGDPGGGGFIPSWRLCRPEDAPNMKVSLPAHALPLPAGEVQP